MTITPLPIVDSHVHVWSNDPAFSWAAQGIDPPLRDASPEALLASMQAASVAAAVLVQYIGYRWDNEYVARALAAFPDRFMGVCRVDPQDPAAPDHLGYWTEQRGFHGVRISPEPDARGDWFRGPLMRPFFQRAAALGIPVLLLTKPSRLPDLIDTLDRVPDVDVVIDHVADCDVADPQHRQLLRTLAGNPRVFLKTGHLWAGSAEDYPWRDRHALLKHVRDVFGTDRIMWGSDWSFCLRHATYGRSLSYLRDEADFLSREELAWILSGTARRLWAFPRLAALADRPAAGAGGDAGDDIRVATEDR